MIPNIFSLLGESIVGKHIAKGIIFSNSPKKFHPNGSRIQVKVRGIQVRALSDSKQSLVGTTIDCIPCIAPDAIDRKKDLVIVTKDNPENVISDLQKKGIENTVSYDSIGRVVYDTLPIKQMYWSK